MHVCLSVCLFDSLAMSVCPSQLIDEESKTMTFLCLSFLSVCLSVSVCLCPSVCVRLSVLNNGAPSYLSTDYNILGDTVNYNLRGGDYNKLSLPKPKTDSLKRSFRYEGAKIWNSLQISVKTSHTLNEFKRKL
jgi:hypothetical protein